MSGRRHGLRGYEVASVIPATVNLNLEQYLPNGPYGTMAGMGLQMYIPLGCTYAEAKKAMLKAWVEGRGTMMNMNINGHVGRSNYSEKWKVQEIKFRGGVVHMDAAAQEGDHQVSMALLQKTTSSCTVS